MLFKGAWLKFQKGCDKMSGVSAFADAKKGRTIDALCQYTKGKLHRAPESVYRIYRYRREKGDGPCEEYRAVCGASGAGRTRICPGDGQSGPEDQMGSYSGGKGKTHGQYGFPDSQ